jgi:hypothetical protein
MKNSRKSQMRYENQNENEDNDNDNDNDKDIDIDDENFDNNYINHQEDFQENPNIPYSQKYNNIKSHNSPLNIFSKREKINEEISNDLKGVNKLSNKKNEIIDCELDCTNKFLNISQFEQSINSNFINNNININNNNNNKYPNAGKNQSTGLNINPYQNSENNKYKDALINYEKIQKFKIIKEDYENNKDKEKKFNSPLSSLENNDNHNYNNNPSINTKQNQNQNININRAKGKSSYFDEMDTELKNNTKILINDNINLNNNNIENMFSNTNTINNNIDDRNKKEGEFGYKRDDSLMKLNNNNYIHLNNFNFTENDNIDFESEAYSNYFNNKQLNKIESDAFLVKINFISLNQI